MRPFLAEIETLGLDPIAKLNITPNNAARLFGFSAPTADHQTPKSAPAAALGPLTLMLPVAALAAEWPAVGELLAKRGFQWSDEPHPLWEPLGQAASVKGYTPQQQQALLEEILIAVEEINDGST